MNRLEVNKEIHRYWKEEGKKLVELKPLSKDKVPSFTRHNGNRIKRLKKVWRKPKGTGTNTLTCPKIGYKRPSHKRFRRASDGILKRVLKNIKDLEDFVLNRKKYEVGIFSSVMGAKKRKILLEKAKILKAPIYL